ncbi:hypothetical protein BX666DRAFT_2026646 [Dichotomocladium elegans]|nr:hypothetical protein BX666DRAFT_2026646 [Dichotomocladium elegans]
MLKSLGDFISYGSQHTLVYEHLVEDADKSQEIDFSLFAKGSNWATKRKAPTYNLYAVDERPSIAINELSDTITETNTPTNTMIGNRHKRRIPNGAMDLEEELYVDGSTVVWSRGKHIVKSFKYELEQQPVELALFAWFRFELVRDPDDPSKQRYVAVDQWYEYGQDSPVNEHGNEDLSASFSIMATNKLDRKRKHFHEDTTCEISESSSIRSTSSTDTSPNTRIENIDHGTKQDAQHTPKEKTMLRKALCVILRDTVKIYFEDGLMYSIHLYYPVQRACALHVGLLLELKRAELIDSANAASLQPFISILNPMGGPELVTMVDEQNKSFSLDFRKTASMPVDHELIFAAAFGACSRGKQQLVVTYNTKKNAYAVWMFTDDKERSRPSKMIHKPVQHTLQAPLKHHKRSKGKQIKRGPVASPLQATPPPLTRKDSLARFHEDFSSDTDQLFGSEAGDSLQESADEAGYFLSPLYETNPTKGERRKQNSRDKVFLAHDPTGLDLLCIMRSREQMLVILNVQKLLENSIDPVHATISARSAIAVTSSKGHKDIIILRGSNRLFLVLDTQKEILVEMGLPSSMSERIKELRDSVIARFNVELVNGKLERFRADLSPESGQVQDALAALSCALSPIHFVYLRKRYLECFCVLLSSRVDNEKNRVDAEWEAFVTVLLSFLPIKSIGNTTDTVPLLDKQSSRNRRNMTAKKHEDAAQTMAHLAKRALALRENSTSENLSDKLNAIIAYLHVLYEEYRLSQIKSVQLLPKLAALLVFLCKLTGRDEWLDFYSNNGCILDVNVPVMLEFNIPKDQTYPLDIVSTLRYYQPNAANYTQPEGIFSFTRINPWMETGELSFGRTIAKVWLLYEALGTGGHEKMVGRMVLEGIRRYEIEDIHPVIAKPLLDALDYCGKNPPMTWTSEHYEIIGRQDMANQLSVPRVVDPNSEKFRLEVHQPKKIFDMHDLWTSITTPSLAGSSTYAPDILNNDTERLRFGYDGILETVRITLDSSRVPEMTVPERPDLGDAEVSAEHQTHVMNLVQRTMGLSVGRGIYRYGTFKPDLTKVFPTDSINLSAKLLPLRTVVQADDRYWSQDYLDWPQFHNGVAAGLRISPSIKVGGSWIDFCNREDLQPVHGGFLLALGLNGNLKELPLISWYRYMTQSCELVTAGFVLGIAVAYRGTKDSKVIKLLSANVESLLPPGSQSLTRRVLVNATCLASLGMVYMGSCDRLMSAVMLREIGRHAYADPSTLEPNFESCSLAAGFALGFITLGCGDESPALFDLRLKENLYQLMTGNATMSTAVAASAFASLDQAERGAGDASSSSPTEGKEKPINLDVTSPGASIALGLMYLKTNNRHVANRVDILDTRPYLNYIRPDFLMLRVIAKNLIMWDHIRPMDDWIEGHLPGFILEDLEYEQQHGSSQLIEASKQAMYNIIGGACLSMGLRYAGSDNRQAFRCLLGRLDMFIKLSNAAATSFQERITRSVVRTCVDVVATAAAMVVAGTGNLELLDRLKVLHNRINSHTNYGNHMATHMAMGLLFVGLGGYTLKTTNEAIAGLLCAFYPFYSTSPDDNHYYLQAFRHLWTLALDVRWLIPFDVESGKPCRVPLMIRVQKDEPWANKTKETYDAIRVIAPTVIPSYSLIQSIQVDSPHYYPLQVVLDGGAYHHAIQHSGILYLQKLQATEKGSDLTPGYE